MQVKTIIISAMNTQQKANVSQTGLNDIRLMQEKLKQLLFAIDKVCNEHNLRYYLIAGTMLGAKRHRGFIPWDDDADIGMPRSDYEIFLKNAHQWLPQNYELIYGGNDERYPYPFARVQDAQTTYILRRNFPYLGGVPIDVFPLDGITSNKLKQKIHYCKYRFFVKLLYYTLVNPYKHGKGWYYWLVTACNKIFSSSCLHKIINNIQKEYSYEKSDLVVDHDNVRQRGILQKCVYGYPTPILFEEKELKGVAQPETYLEYCYGNYMEIPPLPKRPKCNFRYMNLYLPYKEYQKSVIKTMHSHQS